MLEPATLHHSPYFYAATAPSSTPDTTTAALTALLHAARVPHDTTRIIAVARGDGPLPESLDEHAPLAMSPWALPLSVSPAECARIAGRRGTAAVLTEASRAGGATPLIWTRRNHGAWPAGFRAWAADLVESLVTSQWFSDLPGSFRLQFVDGIMQREARARVWAAVPQSAWPAIEAVASRGGTVPPDDDDSTDADATLAAWTAALGGHAHAGLAAAALTIAREHRCRANDQPFPRAELRGERPLQEARIFVGRPPRQPPFVRRPVRAVRRVGAALHGFPDRDRAVPPLINDILGCSIIACGIGAAGLAFNAMPAAVPEGIMFGSGCCFTAVALAFEHWDGVKRHPAVRAARRAVVEYGKRRRARAAGEVGRRGGRAI